MEKKQLLSSKLNHYLDNHTHPELALHQRLKEHTEQHIRGAYMISGHLQGNLLIMISKILQPKCIFDIGTFTGYSALCLVEGLHNDGKLYSFDKDRSHINLIREYWDQHQRSRDMILLTGDAHEQLKDLDLQPDLVFIDADKKGYVAYYDLLIEKMKSGGVILADNVLFNGEVIEKSEADWSNTATAMHRFNEYVKDDPRVEVVILPIRDGISIIRKK